uniref:NADH-ubiquinone oxidoreductase chain 6 n=1 Tax=Pedetontinus luanchuanensis TaxID=1527581 RepID=A0A0B4N517_9INSE|nr:NADH dehydrogenase subunit 6 [Pedetontinus luanchuanensis]
MFMNLMLMLWILLTNIILMYTNHPIAMGLTLMMQTTFISLLTGTMYMSYWFSYILFLIFLGGLLVLFIYIASLASNEMFLMSMKMMSLFMLITFLLLMLFLNLDTLTFPIKIINSEAICSWKEMNNFMSTSISKFYINMIAPITIILVMYLFLTLIVTVKITKIYSGPLRKMY